MEKQDIPKEKKLIESITYSFGKAMSLLFGCIVGFSFITSIALAYEGGFIGWSIIGYKLMKLFVVVGIMYFIMCFSKTIVYKINERLCKAYNKRNERKKAFKDELKKEIVKELKNGRSTTKRKSS
jgi:uncharacterized membrane protein